MSSKVTKQAGIHDFFFIKSYSFGKKLNKNLLNLILHSCSFAVVVCGMVSIGFFSSLSTFVGLFTTLIASESGVCSPLSVVNISSSLPLINS